jgi:hypothetical protein
MRRDGPTVRLYIRNACDWTLRLAAIAAAAEQIKAKSFTIDGKAAVLRPDSWSRFEELSRREATRIAILGAFDLIERDGDDLRDLPFLDRKTALARLLRDIEAGPYRVRARLPVGHRGHRFKVGGRHLSMRPVPRLDQDPQSSQHRRAAGAERDVEQVMTGRRLFELISPFFRIDGHFRPTECLIGAASCFYMRAPRSDERRTWTWVS